MYYGLKTAAAGIWLASFVMQDFISLKFSPREAEKSLANKREWRISINDLAEFLKELKEVTENERLKTVKSFDNL